MSAFCIALLRPYEALWGWHIRRQYRRGKFRKPEGV